jgi:RNA-directed DNA polymerase
MACRCSLTSPGGAPLGVQTDIANCVEAMSHVGLLLAIQERVCDRAVRGLVRGGLRAGDAGRVAAARHGWRVAGRGDLPAALQRLPASAGPGMVEGRRGVLMGYADDALVMCTSRRRPRSRD